MKPLPTLLFALVLPSCSVRLNDDGSKDVTVDAVALGAIADAYIRSKQPPVATPVTSAK